MKPAPTIPANDLLKALQALKPSVGKGGFTFRELRDMVPEMSERALRLFLREQHAKGKLTVIRRPYTDITGRTTPVPTYSLKP